MRRKTGKLVTEKKSTFYKDVPLPDYEQLVNCMHCGMCLPACPTYQITGNEIDSPRGRIRLIKAVADGELDLTDRFKETLDFCLDCQACVTACPAGVEYGQLVEAAKLHIEAHNRETGQASKFKNFILNWLFSDLKRLSLVGRLMSLYQKSGIESLIQKSGMLKLISTKLHDMTYMAPKVSRFTKYRLAQNQLPEKSQKIKVGMIAGCVQDIFFRDVNQDTIDVLIANGYQVFIPETNICCGSVHGHNGELDMARNLARQMIDAFNEAHVDVIVLNSAGCGAYMKEYVHLLAEDPDYRSKAKKFSNKVLDISEFLDQYKWRAPESEMQTMVTYHEPCHLVHTQKISAEPRKMIMRIPGIHFIELPESTWCCGSAGIYNVIRYEDSMQVLERKMNNIRNTGVASVITGNPGCMIQLMYGAKKFKVEIEVLHPVSLLNRAYQQEGAAR
jgi:glycolate oxidase iron-sulfur subunit